MAHTMSCTHPEGCNCGQSLLDKKDRRIKRLEKEVAKLEARLTLVAEAMHLAGYRWPEWGGRASRVGAALNKALER